MTDQSEEGSIPGNYLDIIIEACSKTCEPDSHSNWILNEIRDQIKENTQSEDERKFLVLLHRIPHHILHQTNSPHVKNIHIYRSRYLTIRGLNCILRYTFIHLNY